MRQSYLQPEPILRSPNAQVAYAYAGHSLPVYSYAGNNPVHFIDRTGSYFTVNGGRNGGTSGQAWGAIGRLAGNPFIGDYIRQMAADPVHEYRINDSTPFSKYGGGRTRNLGTGTDIFIWHPYASSNDAQCRSGSLPRNTIPTYSYDALLAHELGHAWGFGVDGQDQGSWVNQQGAVDFENAVRVLEGNPLRLEHESFTAGCPTCPM